MGAEELTNSAETEINLRAYWDILVHRWLYVVAVFLFTLFVTGVITFTADPVYRAQAEILIRSNNATLQSLGIPEELLSPFGGGKNELANEKQLLLSQEVLRRLQIRLATDSEYLASSRPTRGSAIASEGTNVVDMPVPDVDSLKEAIEVAQIPDTDMLRVTVTSHSPVQAAAIANALVAVFQDFDRERARSSIQAVVKFLDQKIQETQDQLELSEQELVAYAKEAGIPLESDALAAKITRLEQLLAEAQVELEDKRSQLETVNKFLNDIKQEFLNKLASEQEGAAFLTEVMDKLTLIRQIQRQITDWEDERQQHLTQGNYIKAQELEQKIENKRRELEQEAADRFSLLEQFPQYEELIKQQLDLTLEIIALENRVSILEKQRDRELQALNEHGLQLARLQRELDVTQDLYDMIMTEYAKTRIVEMGELGSVEVVNLAEVPSSPFKPNKPLNLFVGAFLGVLAGVGVAFLREALETAFKSKEEAEAVLNVPVLATVPKIAHAAKRWQFEEVKELLLPHFKEGGIEREAFSALSTNLRFVAPDKPLQTLLITGPGPKIGKSLVAANLALAIGGDVVLVEADLRKPILHKVFEIDRKDRPGLTDVVLGDATLEEAIVEISFEGFPPIHVLLAGTKPPNVLEFISSGGFVALLEELKAKFRHVLIDTPPVHIASDAVVLATRVDGIIFVVDASRTSKREAVEAKRVLERYKANIVGVVMNKVPRSRATYYGYYYYQYDYYRKKEGEGDSEE